jgi:hypothetical protein
MNLNKEDTMVMQTLILSKEVFETKEEANDWVRDHDFKIKEGAPDETEESWRYRQREPSEFKDDSFRTIEITDGVKAVVGKLKDEESKMSESLTRGTELLMSFNLEHNQVQKLSFSVDRFKTPAAAKSWCKNHGFKISESPRLRKAAVIVKVQSEDKFEDGTIHTEKISKGVTAQVGILKHVKKIEPEEKVISDPDTPKEKKIKRASTEVEFAKRGELLIIKKEDEDPEVSVRMFGIVMKPEVPDCVGDVTSHEEVENANFVFMKEFGTMGFMHKKDVSDRVQIIQDVIAPVDFEFPIPGGEAKKIAQGTWYQELYTDDPELTKRVREGTLNGLSIGGKARREEITEMADGIIKLLPDLPFKEQQKRELERIVAKRNVNKAEGDEALGRFHNLRVEEVSLVDAAANEEDFFIIKRRIEMTTQEKEAAEAKAKAEAEAKVKAEAKAKAEADAKTKAEESEASASADDNQPAEPTLAEQVAAGIEAGIKAGLEAAANKAVPASAPVVDEDPVAKGFKDLNSRLDGIEAGLKETTEKVDKVATVKAAAKGTSVPEGTTSPNEEKTEVSKWAGSAVHQRFGNKK